METGMQHTTVKHNPLTFYLRMLLYMFVGLLLRLLALAPLACLFVFPAVAAPPHHRLGKGIAQR